MKTPLASLKISRHLQRMASALFTSLFLWGCTDAQSVEIETTTNLIQLSAEASQQQIPIMLFVTSPSCGYCHILERDVIVPMLKNAHYQDKVLLRRLDLGQNQMIDFDGETKDPMRIAARYKAQLTPTIVFLAPNGQQLQDHILGVVKDVDQYGGMIDSRLNRSLEMLGNPLRIDHTR